VRPAHCEWSAGMMVRWQKKNTTTVSGKFVGGLGGKSQILGVRSQDLRMSIPIGVTAVRPIEVGGRSIFRHTSGPRGAGPSSAHTPCFASMVHSKRDAIAVCRRHILIERPRHDPRRYSRAT
jgi:hypothetical protein